MVSTPLQGSLKQSRGIYVKANEGRLWASKDSGVVMAAQRRDTVGAVRAFVACLVPSLTQTSGK